MSKSLLAQQAAAFHAANPHVLTALKTIVAELRSAGVTACGIKALFERLRWMSWFETSGDRYRLNNNYHAWYARKLIEEDPSLMEMFELRTLWSKRRLPDVREVNEDPPSLF